MNGRTASRFLSSYSRCIAYCIEIIIFLRFLEQTFQSYMQFKEIPRKLVVAKRLAQCLNPALPTGVHQRALEVYVHILAVLGVRIILSIPHTHDGLIILVLKAEGLRRDLSLWSPGLFPFFEYAATSVKVRDLLARKFSVPYAITFIKPTLLNIYDTHYLPLQLGLRPIMKSFILALLPGLEEETGEFFEKVCALLQRLDDMT